MSASVGISLNKSDTGKTVYGVPFGCNRYFGGGVEEFLLYHVRGPVWGKFKPKSGMQYQTLRLDNGNSEFMFKNRGNRNGYHWFRNRQDAEKCNRGLTMNSQVPA